ncbi:MAG: DUF4340 domain-containing protein [Bacillota bacterium]|nr:DUF4340 domain-containing protein [Bacillota bacterium]
MNKARKIRLLVMLLCLVLAVIAYLAVNRSQKKDEADEQEPESYPVTDIDTADVTEIGIINGDNTTDLIKEGDQWRLVENDAVSIDNDSVDSFLMAAGKISSDTRIEKVEDFAQYGLEDPILNITLQWDSNMYNLKVGDYNSMIGCYYIRLNEESTVYTISSSIYYSLNKTLEDFEAVETETEEDTVTEDEE